MRLAIARITHTAREIFTPASSPPPPPNNPAKNTWPNASEDKKICSTLPVQIAIARTGSSACRQKTLFRLGSCGCLVRSHTSSHGMAKTRAFFEANPMDSSAYFTN